VLVRAPRNTRIDIARPPASETVRISPHNVGLEILDACGLRRRVAGLVIALGRSVAPESKSAPNREQWLRDRYERSQWFVLSSKEGPLHSPNPAGSMKTVR